MGIGHNRQYSHVTLKGEKSDEKILGLGYLCMVLLTALDFSLSHRDCYNLGYIYVGLLTLLDVVSVAGIAHEINHKVL